MTRRSEKNRRAPAAHMDRSEGGYTRAKVETRKAPRAPIVPTKNAVACPTCKAGVGSFCVTAKGGSMLTYHVARRRMAVRKYTEQKENQHGED